MAEAAEVNERFALELRAEKLRTLAGGEWKRRGDADTVAVGRGGLTDFVVGRETLDVRGSLTERSHGSRTTALSGLDTRVDGHLSMKTHADTTLLGGGIQEAHIGAEVVVAGMSDDLIVGAANRTTAVLSLWCAGLIGADEVMGSCFTDGSLIEAFGVCFEREYYAGTHHVHSAFLSGNLYSTQATAFKKYFKATRGVKNTLPGSGGSGSSASSSPPSPATGASAAQAGSGGAVAAGRGGRGVERASDGGPIRLIGQADNVDEAVEVARSAPEVENSRMAASADMLSRTDDLGNPNTVDEMADEDLYATVNDANRMRDQWQAAEDGPYATVGDAGNGSAVNWTEADAAYNGRTEPMYTPGTPEADMYDESGDIYTTVGDAPYWADAPGRQVADSDPGKVIPASRVDVEMPDGGMVDDQVWDRVFHLDPSQRSDLVEDGGSLRLLNSRGDPINSMNMEDFDEVGDGLYQYKWDDANFRIQFDDWKPSTDGAAVDEVGEAQRLARERMDQMGRVDGLDEGAAAEDIQHVAVGEELYAWVPPRGPDARGSLTDIAGTSLFDDDVAPPLPGSSPDMLLDVDGVPFTFDNRPLIQQFDRSMSLGSASDVSGQRAFRSAPDAGVRGGIADTAADLGTKATGDPAVTPPRGERVSEWGPSAGTSAGSPSPSGADDRYASIDDAVEARNQYLRDAAAEGPYASIDDAVAARNEYLSDTRGERSVDWNAADAAYNGRRDPVPLPFDEAPLEPPPTPRAVTAANPADPDDIYAVWGGTPVDAWRPGAEIGDADPALVAPGTGPELVRLDMPADGMVDGEPWDGVVHISAWEANEVMNNGGLLAVYNDAGDPQWAMGMDQFDELGDGRWQHKHANFQIQVGDWQSFNEADWWNARRGLDAAGADDAADLARLRDLGDTGDNLYASLDEVTLTSREEALWRELNDLPPNPDVQGAADGTAGSGAAQGAPPLHPLRLETPQDPRWDGIHVVDQSQAQGLLENNGVLNWTREDGSSFDLTRADFEEFPADGYTHYHFDPRDGGRPLMLEIHNRPVGTAGDAVGGRALDAAGGFLGDAGGNEIVSVGEAGPPLPPRNGENPPPLPPRNGEQGPPLPPRPGEAPPALPPRGERRGGAAAAADAGKAPGVYDPSDPDDLRRALDDGYTLHYAPGDGSPPVWTPDSSRGLEDTNFDFDEDVFKDWADYRDHGVPPHLQEYWYRKQPNVFDPQPFRDDEGRVIQYRNYMSDFGRLDEDLTSRFALSSVDAPVAPGWDASFMGPSAWGSSERQAAESLAASSELVSSVDSSDEVAALLNNAPTPTALTEAADANPRAAVQGDEIEAAGMHGYFSATPGGPGRVTSADVNAPLDDMPMLRGQVEETPPPIPVKQRQRMDVPPDEAPPPIPVKQRRRVDVPPDEMPPPVPPRPDQPTDVPSGIVPEGVAAVDESRGRYRYLVEGMEAQSGYAVLVWDRPPDSFPAPVLDEPEPLAYFPRLSAEDNPPAMPRKRSRVQPETGGAAGRGAPPEIPRYLRTGSETGDGLPGARYGTEEWDAFQEGFVRNIGVSDEPGPGQGQFYRDISEFVETHPELLDAHQNGQLSLEMLQEIFLRAEHHRLVEGNDITHLRSVVEAEHLEKAMDALGIPMTALDDVSSVHDDLVEVGTRLTDGASLNSPDAARSLDEATGSWFDDMAQSRGADGLDDADDFETRASWLEEPEDDAADFEDRAAWLQGRAVAEEEVPPPLPPRNRQPGQETVVVRTEEVGGVGGTFRPRLKTDTQFSQIDPVATGWEGRYPGWQGLEEEYLNREIALLENERANIMKRPGYENRPELQRMVADIDIQIMVDQGALSAISQGQDPVEAMRISAMAASDRFGPQDPRTIAYLETMNTMANPNRSTDLPPTGEQIDGLGRDWTKRAEVYRAEGRKLTGGGAPVEGSWRQRMAVEMYAAEADMVIGIDPTPRLSQFATRLEASGYGDPDIMHAMIREYRSVFGAYVKP